MRRALERSEGGVVARHGSCKRSVTDTRAISFVSALACKVKGKSSWAAEEEAGMAGPGRGSFQSSLQGNLEKDLSFATTESFLRRGAHQSFAPYGGKGVGGMQGGSWRSCGKCCWRSVGGNATEHCKLGGKELEVSSAYVS
ncbi:hypothetical protein L7F22_031541 [Adiantum nelumboides]|nr:hypothetical protein [Adiantum nelumboides]